MMEYRNLGTTGLKVSRLALGGAHIGEALDKAAARDVIHAGLDVGINAFYTADDYNGGAAEAILGQALESRRDDVVLMTKVGYRVGKMSMPEYVGTTGSSGVELDHTRLWKKGIAPSSRGLSRKHLVKALEDSLRRLRTDYIDVYQIHFWDQETPIEETLEAFHDFVRQGKVLYVGCSQTTAWQLYRALWVSELQGYPRFESIQVRFNLFDRAHLTDTLPAAHEAGVGVLTFNSLCGGLLSGISDFGAKPDNLPDRGFQGMYTDIYWKPKYIEFAQQLGKLAAEFGRHPAELAQGWVLAHEAVTSLLIGPMAPGELEVQARSTDNPLSEEEFAAVQQLAETLGS